MTKRCAFSDLLLKRLPSGPIEQRKDITISIKDGHSLIILSDRKINENRVALSSLLASSALHRHLVACSERTQVGIIVETGEAREVHHFCLMTGFGADAINPYLAFEALWQARRDHLIESESDEAIIAAYCKGVGKGMLKVMAKMGIHYANDIDLNCLVYRYGKQVDDVLHFHFAKYQNRHRQYGMQCQRSIYP
jgi:hypothetical protein